ncbi:IclR family transcriptional regulator [Micromonospora cathayae]|uniref:IclR family transcriptional regulator C-terminal domain-containing protein n=1 Tax=Micromonospora cathayae TaxID=3028804 RepID=A0ABY7ZM63_9ACTN|nr:IclR family transcriptional regulator C-terminal domain-containing protein [Micromonospora sp. HUAS 3]WDZ83851.1 IclR family transcriptional regulator C-terminal domain-containing protein [Micromonospora sp. HUAS 3]
MTELENETTEQRGVRSVIRALNLLSATARGSRTLTELAGAAGVSLSTASRLLATLRMADFLDQDEDGQFVPGPELTALLYASDQWSGVRKLAREAATGLRDELDETVAFFVRAGNDRVCIESAESARLVRRVCHPGERGPVYLGAAGKALIAFNDAEHGYLGLPPGTEQFTTESGAVRTLADLRAECARIREEGMGYSGRESTEESWAVAAPVFRGDLLLGVLAVVVPMTRSDEQYVAKVQAALRRAAAAASR